MSRFMRRPEMRRFTKAAPEADCEYFRRIRLGTAVLDTTQALRHGVLIHERGSHTHREPAAESHRAVLHGAIVDSMARQRAASNRGGYSHDSCGEIRCPTRSNVFL